MNDAIAYTHEIEYLCDVLDELFGKSELCMQEVSSTAYLKTDYGINKVRQIMTHDIAPYQGLYLAGLNRDIVDDLLFIIKGLTFLLDNPHDL